MFMEQLGMGRVLSLPGAFGHPEVRPWRFRLVLTIGQQRIENGNIIMLEQSLLQKNNHKIVDGS